MSVLSLTPMNNSYNVTNVTNINQVAITNQIKFYVDAIIILTGLCGNTLSICVFLKSRLTMGNVGAYLIALGFADNIVLMTEIPIWMVQTPLSYSAIDEYSWLCRTTYYLKYVGRMWSAFLTLVITVERYLFIAYPLKKAYFQRHNIHKAVIPVTLVLCLLSVTYSLFLIGLEIDLGQTERQCMVTKNKKKLFITLDIIIIRIIGDLFIGGMVILVTVFSIKVLTKAKEIRKTSLREQSSFCSSCGKEPNRSIFLRKIGKSRESQITRMLLMLAILFIIFKIPYTLCYYVNFYFRNLKDNGEAATTSSIQGISFRYIQQASHCFALLNYSINFIVYGTLVPSFRNNLKGLLGCNKICKL